MSKKIVSIVGARPNFMKIAPILRALSAVKECTSILVHTGQHYDHALSTQFFQELGIPAPDVNLEVGSGGHGTQTGEIMKRLEPELIALEPDWVVVVGDVNSTLAAALVAAKLHIPVAHVEAGLRSFDRRMPEEINRVVADVLSSLLFVTEPAGVTQLRNEGIPQDRIHLVGDVMIDTALAMRPQAEATRDARWAGRLPPRYGLVTLHRPSNVDDPLQLEAILDALEQASQRLPLIFAVHPRTESRLKTFGLWQRLSEMPGIILQPPLGYLEFLGLLTRATAVITDSGGIQSEAAWLKVPCLTLRDSTERPITLELGVNRLLGTDPRALLPALESLLRGDWPTPGTSPLLDGHAAERIVSLLLSA